MMRTNVTLSGIFFLIVVFLSPFRVETADAANRKGEEIGKVKRQKAKRKKKSSKNSKLKRLYPQTKNKTKFATMFSYSISTDLNDELTPRVYTHNVSLAPSIIWNKSTSSYIGASVFYESLERDVSDDSIRGEVDFSLGLSGRFQLGKARIGKHSISMFGGFVYPTGDHAKFEGYKGITRASVGLISNFWGKRYKLTNTVSGRYIHNSFDNSPSAPFESNQDYVVEYSLGNYIQLFKHCFFNLGFNISQSHQLNGNTTSTFGNSQSLSFILEAWSVIFRHSNRGHSDQESVRLWFIDQNRNIVNFSVSYTL